MSVVLRLVAKSVARGIAKEAAERAARTALKTAVRVVRKPLFQLSKSLSEDFLKIAEEKGLLSKLEGVLVKEGATLREVFGKSFTSARELAETLIREVELYSAGLPGSEQVVFKFQRLARELSPESRRAIAEFLQEWTKYAHVRGYVKTFKRLSPLLAALGAEITWLHYEPEAIRKIVENTEEKLCQELTRELCSCGLSRDDAEKIARELARDLAPRLVYEWLQTAEGQTAQLVPGGALVLQGPVAGAAHKLVAAIRRCVEAYLDLLKRVLPEYIKLCREYWKKLREAATNPEAREEVRELAQRIRELAAEAKTVLGEAEKIELEPYLRSLVYAALQEHYLPALAEELSRELGVKLSVADLAQALNMLMMGKVIKLS